MPTANLNVSVGIDIGSSYSKISSYDEKIIAAMPGCDFLKLREEAELYFDEPVFSCVIAEGGGKRREDLIFNAKKAGFKNIEIIHSHEAMENNFDNKNGKILVFDLGASKSEIIFFENSSVIDSEIIQDVCGNEFDKIFASWLSERFSLNLINKKDLLTQAEKFKQDLSFNEKISWRDVDILREDFERLIYFSLKRVSHTVERFLDCYAPKEFIITGGCSEIPAVKKIFSELFSNFNFNIEFNKNFIASGAAKKASSLSSSQEHTKRLDNAAKLSQIRGALIELEDLLTRKQKDRLYSFFRHTEALSLNNPALIKILENLISEIKATGSVKK